jgi:hypothetical protein
VVKVTSKKREKRKKYKSNVGRTQRAYELGSGPIKLLALAAIDWFDGGAKEVLLVS